MKAAKNEYKFENNEARDRNLQTGAVIEFIISVICLDNAAGAGGLENKGIVMLGLCQDVALFIANNQVG